MKIMNMTDAILTAKKVLTLRGFVQTLEGKMSRNTKGQIISG